MGKKKVRSAPKKGPQKATPSSGAVKTQTAPQPPPTPSPPKPSKLPKCLGVFINREYKTCLALEKKDGHVIALIIAMDKGLQIIHIPEQIFDKEWRFADKSPVERAAKIYAEFTQYLGASDDALVILQQFTSLSPKEVEMAKKKATERANPVVPASSKKGKAQAAAEEKKAAKKENGGKPQTASQLFQKLIMEGKLNDDQIFGKVKEEFGLSDKKRGYVKWYRNHLKKTGQNPPEPKESKEHKETKKAAPQATA